MAVVANLMEESRFLLFLLAVMSTSLNDAHVEKARNILNALPHMSKDIVDDTIYEKVLSFLSSFLNSEAHGVAMYNAWNVLNILTEVRSKIEILRKALLSKLLMSVRFF